VKALNWAKFFAALLGTLSDLARDLFVRHGGDAEAAKAELQSIRDHGARRREAQAAMDRELEADAAKKRAAAGAFGKGQP
jgi:hypothetical protein